MAPWPAGAASSLPALGAEFGNKRESVQFPGGCFAQVRLLSYGWDLFQVRNWCCLEPLRVPGAVTVTVSPVPCPLCQTGLGFWWCQFSWEKQVLPPCPAPLPAAEGPFPLSCKVNVYN